MIKNAIKNIHRLSSLPIQFADETEGTQVMRVIDKFAEDPNPVIVAIEGEEKPELLRVYEKVEIRSVESLISSIMMTYGNVLKIQNELIIVSNYIHPDVKTYLKDHDFNYAETAGNCHIKKGSIFIHIDGQSVTKYRNSSKKQKFTANQMKLIMAILINPSLLNESYRVMAKESNLALGSIGPIIQNLKNSGYIEMKGQYRLLKNTNELMDKWMELYPFTLFPKNYLGRYRNNTEITEHGQLIQTGKLEIDGIETKDTIHYTSIPKKSIKSKLGLVPDPNGKIVLLKQFWGDSNTIYNPSTKKVNELLNFTDFSNFLSLDSFSDDEQVKINEVFKIIATKIKEDIKKEVQKELTRVKTYNSSAR